MEIVHVEEEDAEPEEEDAEPEQEAPSAVTEVADSEGKKVDISILVVKIADFETLIEDVSPSSVNSLTADYRKTVSTTVGSFGGTVEAHTSR